MVKLVVLALVSVLSAAYPAGTRVTYPRDRLSIVLPAGWHVTSARINGVDGFTYMVEVSDQRRRRSRYDLHGHQLPTATSATFRRDLLSHAPAAVACPWRIRPARGGARRRVEEADDATCSAKTASLQHWAARRRTSVHTRGQRRDSVQGKRTSVLRLLRDRETRVTGDAGRGPSTLGQSPDRPALAGETCGRLRRGGPRRLRPP